MSELLYIVPAFCGMAAVVAVGHWWFEAHTRWLTRLSARGIIETHVEAREPHGRPRIGRLWRQRLAPGDARRLRRLRHEPDQDRSTEIWRIRGLRRGRLSLCVGVAWLASIGLAAAVFGIAGWVGVTGLAAFLAVVCLVSGRRVYERARTWADGDR
jgi:Flp pilus assembly protein TadB